MTAITLLGDCNTEIDFGPNLELMTEDLDLAIARFYRTHHDYANQCKDATKDFGFTLIEPHFGKSGKRPLFKVFPGTQYFDLRSEGPFHNSYGDFHSIGLIALKPSKKELELIALDLTHRGTHRTAIFHASQKEELLDSLHQYYGGTWKPESILDPETKKYRWIGDASVGHSLLEK